MALTNDNPKEVLTTLFLIADIKTALEAAPDWENLVKKAYGLSEKEQARADAARQTIADNQAVLSDITKQREGLATDITVLDAKQIENQAALQRIADNDRKQERRKSDQDAREEQQNQRESDLQKREDALKDGQNQLAQDNADLKKRKDATDAEASALNAAAEQMKAIKIGL